MQRVPATAIKRRVLNGKNRNVNSASLRATNRYDAVSCKSMISNEHSTLRNNTEKQSVERA